MSVRLIPAPIDIELSKADKEEFEREYQSLSESDDDPISQWLKLAKARGETAESDPVLLNLMVELHRKIDALEMFLKNEQPKRLPLDLHVAIESIGYEHFKLKEEVLKPGEIYYGRIAMPVHPKRDVPVFVKAIDKSLVEIKRLHERDEKEWNAYVAARERVLIREAKEKRNK